MTLVKNVRASETPARSGRSPTVAIALGSGGARGLAHVAVLEALDDLGVKPVAIAGTSIGAVVGAAYASGMRATDIRSFAASTLRDSSRVMRRLVALQVGRIRGHLREAGLFGGLPIQMDALAIAEEFLEEVIPARFEELSIPLQVVATDLWAREEVVFEDGPLRPAVAASAAIPGIARPVEFEGRLLIDGGTMNPLPFDLLRGRADILVAVDITRMSDRDERAFPSTLESVVLAYHIMTSAIVSEKLKSSAPDLLFRPQVHAFGALDFFRATPILRAAEPIKEEVKRKLAALMEKTP